MNQLTCYQLMFGISVLLVILNSIEIFAFFNYSLELKNQQAKLEIDSDNDRQMTHQLEIEVKNLRIEMERTQTFVQTMENLFYTPPFANQPHEQPEAPQGK